jgi:CheY-like chemotaxis protein
MPSTLLLVEDNEDDVFFLQFALRKLALPCELRVARDGRDARARLQAAAAGDPELAPICLVLLDLKLPHLGGLELLAWMRSVPDGRFPPVVVLAAAENESDLDAAARLGAVAFLPKPNRPDQLVELLRTLDAYWLSKSRPPPPAGSFPRLGTLEAAGK